MARTEVKLNSVYYRLKRLPTQVLANQMASKVGQGTSEYGDLTTWSAWIQQDWQEGNGKIKPHLNGGMLYGEAESRVPGQLILPPKISQSATEALSYTFSSMGATIDGQVVVGSGSYTRVAATFYTPAAGILATQKYWVYANIPVGVNLTFAIYTNVSSAPGVLVTSTTYTPPEGNVGYYWHGVAMAGSGTISINTTYWLVVYPTTGTNTMTWATAQTWNGLVVGKSFNGSAWAALPVANQYPIFSTNLYQVATVVTNSGSGFFRSGVNLYCFCNLRIYRWETSTSVWVIIGVITDHQSVTGAVNFVDRVYFGNGGLTTTDYTTFTPVGEVRTSTGLNGKIFTKFKGLLYRAYLNYVEYSDDGTVWEPTATITPGQPIYVSDTSDPVTGLCGMGDIMYAATATGLVPIFPGDIISGGKPWGSIDAQNGMRMVEFENALYITVNGRVVRYTEDGSTQDVWMTRDDDVLAGRIGPVWDLERCNNWLFALVGSDETNGKPTVWAYQNNSWHHIATLPNSSSAASDIYIDYDLFYDRATQRLWCITPDAAIYHWYISDYSLNPFNDVLSRYSRTAWIEWDWFDGQILEADKDYDSVTIMGENFDATCYVQVYWKDDASTAWELLGTVDSNHEELRWTLGGGTRPNTTRFKLAMLMFTADSTQTPRLRAFRVKYHLMVRDWFRWNVVVDVSGQSGAYQMLGDGTRNNLTASQIKTNLSALCTQVAPFVYQDVDGSLYEVKITDGNFQYNNYEYNESTLTERWEGQYVLTLEQTTPGVYVA